MVNSYTTVPYIEAELRLTSSLSSSTIPTSTTVSRWITEASEEVDMLTNNVYSSTTATSVYVDYDGSGILLLPYTAIQSLTLKYNKNDYTAQSTDWVTLEEGTGKNYLLYSDSGEVVFINGNYATNKLVPCSGAKRFCITTTYGESAVPLSIQHLTTLMVSKRMLLSMINSQANSEGGTIQVGTISISDPSMFSQGYITKLSDEIDRLKADIGVGLIVYRPMRFYG